MPDFWSLEKHQASCIHVVGLDGIPSPCRVELEGQILTISRGKNESGKVHLPYPFVDRGELSVCTGTLPESDSPYDLMTELARGTLNRLRNQLSTWQEGGLVVSASLVERVDQATEELGASIVHSDPQLKDHLARSCIEIAMDCIFQLSTDFGDQVAAYRVNQPELSPFVLAANVQKRISLEEEDLSRSFDLWEIADWDSSQSMKTRFPTADDEVIYGPLFDASAGAPAWSGDPAGEFENRKRRVLQKCREQLANLPANTRLLHAISGLNGIGHRHLSFPQQQQLTSELFQVIEDMAVEVPILASFDFPWAERLAWSVGGMHPLQVADSLLRQALPISFIGLDINLDYWPAGSVVRDPLQWIDLIDIWSQLGLPLVVSLRIPQSSGRDADEKPEEKRVNVIRQGMSNRQRLNLVRVVLKVLAARPSVHGCIFRQWSDDDDSRFPAAGLVTTCGEPKDLLRELDRFQCDVLKPEEMDS
ncbi:MAG: hypothetical protein MK108_05140 [Mariniblastus sp.]|nr:hypothetical protein [Mariniblastus sp.]